jgi:cytochrome bd-type quinol oxidase subunit 2
VEDDSDWNRAFFARIIAVLGLPPLAYTVLSAFMLPNEHDGANERLVLVSSSISLAFFLTSLAISHVPYLRKRKTKLTWHFGRMEMSTVVAICALLMFLLLCSCWVLLHRSSLR